MYVVIMAGGSGTRFWPLSRRRRPKQLLRFFGDRTMIAETVARFEGLAKPEEIFIVTNELLADAVREAVPDVPAENVLEEPMGRNTAPCIGMAAMVIRERGGDDAVMAVFPADHFIRDREAFQSAVKIAVAEAEEGAIVTLGIEPTRPETGYGYIRRAGPAVDGVAPVESFVEKPNRETALEYLADGRYLWNAGMFFSSVGTMLGEFEEQLPSLRRQLEQVGKFCIAADRGGLAAVFEEIEPVSIDYGVMEGAKTVRVVPVSFGWSDVGHWDALPDVAETDPEGNVAMGDVVALDCSDSVLVGHDRRVLAAVGLERMVVVDSEDALLVAPRERVQEVRRIVDALKNRKSNIV